MRSLVLTTSCIFLCFYDTHLAEPPERPTKTYYIAAEEVEWDYTPRGNLLDEHSKEYERLYMDQSREDSFKLGHKYKKAILREYTDQTFRVQKKPKPWQGILGPVIEAEIGDLVKVLFLNRASISVSLHPHGVRYKKIHEGALYVDNTSFVEKVDDRVQPGGHYQYDWFINEEDGPSAADPDCLTWLYHSHRIGEIELHAGLLGPLIVCRKGTLHKQPDVDRRFVLVFMDFDENKSPYLKGNLKTFLPDKKEDELNEIAEEPIFQASNLMHTINGYAFGNLPGLDMCEGEVVSWHMIGVGDLVDIHTVTFGGHLVLYKGHRTDAVSLYPAKFTTSHMVARRVGTWPVRCEVGAHAHSGMEAFFRVWPCEDYSTTVPRPRPHLPRAIRDYYIAAEEVYWNYAPSGINQMNGKRLTEDSDAVLYFTRGDTLIGGEYKKVIYQEYTDETFQTIKERRPDQIHLGILGPVIQSEVGDIVRIFFKNKASRPYSLHTHGAFYKNEGNTTAIQPGQMRVYHWSILEQYGPSPGDSNCLAWRYFSDEDFKRDAYAGLAGLLRVCRRGSLDRNGKQKQFDREFTLSFQVVDERDSHYIQENIDTYCYKPEEVDRLDPVFRQANYRHAINGQMYGNLEGLDMCVGDTVSWTLIGLGRSVDIHSVYFHGNTFQTESLYRDSITVVPSTVYTVTMKAENPGDWILECQTNLHLRGGMRAIYRVSDCDGRYKRQAYYKYPRQPMVSFRQHSGKVREYYIAAVEEEWNYTPHDRYLITGEKLLQNEESRHFVRRSDTLIGSKYKKVLYREYLDGHFRFRKPRTEEDLHLGIMGPMIKAEVGDTIRVVFKNLASRPYSIHPHGVVLRNGGGSNHVEEEEVPAAPGETVVYEWEVPERSGPGNASSSCSAWAYYSSVDSIRDTSSGLVGPLITCRRGTLTATGKRKDVDYEFALLFMIFDENESWYLDENIQTYCYRPDLVDKDDYDFSHTNRLHAVNGRIFGTLDGLVSRNATKVAWYVMGLGTEDDMHTVHFHGLTFLDKTGVPRRGDVVDLFPGVFETVEMVMDNPGTWIVHCHVDDHMKYGMAALFTVTN